MLLALIVKYAKTSPCAQFSSGDALLVNGLLKGLKDLCVWRQKASRRALLFYDHGIAG
jgi:hypothetical protein